MVRSWLSVQERHSQQQVVVCSNLLINRTSGSSDTVAAFQLASPGVSAVAAAFWATSPSVGILIVWGTSVRESEPAEEQEDPI